MAQKPPSKSAKPSSSSNSSKPFYFSCLLTGGLDGNPARPRARPQPAESSKRAIERLRKQGAVV
ncbi:MAG: hypothetical protein QXF55_00305 [Candidatus Aenigmatarchaeota archaeon]